MYVKIIWIFLEKVDYKPFCGCWRLEEKICRKHEELRKWRITLDKLKVVDYNLNGVFIFKEGIILY